MTTKKIGKKNQIFILLAFCAATSLFSAQTVFSAEPRLKVTANPNPVNFVPFLPVLIHRPAPGEGDMVDDSQVIYAAHYDIWAADPADCPLCKQGSERLRPKGANWDRLVRGA